MTAPAVEIVAPVDEMSDAIVRATADGLSPHARVRVVERASESADVVVVVQWADGVRRSARVVVRTSDGRTTERGLSFEDGDPPSERGRALGFAVAAMIPEDLRADDEPRKEPSSDTPPLQRPPSPRAPADRPYDGDRTTPDTRLRRSLWLEAAAQGGVGIGGSATGLGGAVAVRIPFEHVALRVGGALRAGNVGEAGASSTLFRGDAGIAFFAVVIDPRITLGARTGIVVLHHALSRTEANGVQTSGTHTLLGAEAMLEGSVALSSRFAVLIAVGTEVAFGQTSVVVSDSRVAELPVLRAVSEAGARFAF